MAKINVFLTGATGYIGGTVLLRFLSRPDFHNLKITILIRSEEKADKFKALGVETIIGSLADLPLLQKAASEADVVIHTADADDLDAVHALLRGLEEQHATTGKVPTFIHTVVWYKVWDRYWTFCACVFYTANTDGQGVLTDNAGGMFAYETIYNDADANQIEALPPTQVHRIVDLAVIDADKKGFTKTYIIFPSLIYGMATGKLVDLGLQNKYSIQLPYLISIALERGQAGMVGEGKNVWPNVHIDDVADLYMVLYNAILSGSNIGHGREGIYFAENGENNFYDLCVEIAKVLVKLGRSSDDKPTTFTKEELDKYFAGHEYFGANSRCKANRSRSIGWKAKRTTEDLFAGIAPEVQYLLDSSEYVQVVKRLSEYFPIVVQKYI